MTNVQIIAAFIVTVIINSLWVAILASTNNFGNLVVDNSTDDEYLFLELTAPVEKLKKKKFAFFRVVRKNYISRK